MKDVGKVMVFSAKPPFNVLKVLDTGPITNHVNIARNAAWPVRLRHHRGAQQGQGVSHHGLRGGRLDRCRRLATRNWPSGDGSRVYVGLENADGVAAIDTLTNKVVATIPNGQAAQALVYVPKAAPTRTSGVDNLQPLGLAGNAVHLTLASADRSPVTTVSLFDQGLTQVLQAAVVGLKPATPYLLALSSDAEGTENIEPIARFMTNPAGGQIVDAVGPIRQIVDPAKVAAEKRRYLAILSIEGGRPGRPVQVQQPTITQSAGR